MSCNQSSSYETKATNDMTAREIVEKNAFINEDPYPESRSTNVGYWTSTRRAAYYRIYKAMTFDKDGVALTLPKNGADLNISEKLFQEMMWPIKEVMEKAKALRDKDEKIMMPNWEEYMNSLLEEPK